MLVTCILLVKPVCAQPTNPHSNQSNTEELSQLSDRILHRIIDIERFYLNYWMYANKEPRFRRMRYFAMQEAAAAGELAQSTVCLEELSRNLRAPSQVRSSNLTRGYIAGFVGTTLGGTSSGIELFSNTYTAIKNKVIGRNPGKAKKTFVQALNEIDNMLEERKVREAKVEDESIRKLHELEGDLLKFFRDWCVFEFVDIYADVKSYQASNSVYYAFDTTANIVSTVSYGQSIRGAKYPNQFGPSGINGIVGDSIFVAEAPVSSIAASFLYKRYFNQICKEINEEPHDPRTAARAARDLFHKRISLSSPQEVSELGAVKKRLDAYRLWNTRYEEYVVEHSKQLRHLDKVARQDNISGPAISFGSLVQCVLGTVSFYRFGNHPQTAQNLNFAGAISGEVANGANIAITTQSLVSQKLYEKELKKRGSLPSQLLEKRLRDLNDMETIIYPDGKLPDVPVTRKP